MCFKAARTSLSICPRRAEKPSELRVSGTIWSFFVLDRQTTCEMTKASGHIVEQPRGKGFMFLSRVRAEAGVMMHATFDKMHAGHHTRMAVSENR
jgi:hypothetical protein